MNSKVSSEWLTSYIMATRPVLEIFQSDIFQTALVRSIHSKERSVVRGFAVVVVVVLVYGCN